MLKLLDARLDGVYSICSFVPKLDAASRRLRGNRVEWWFDRPKSQVQSPHIPRNGVRPRIREQSERLD